MTHLSTLVRGTSFVTNLEKLCQSPKCMEIIEQWRGATQSLHLEQISYRQLSHWEDMGLLQCHREGETGWRRFNLFESTWLHILISLRHFGMSLEHIKTIMPHFFGDIARDCPVKMVEYYVMGSVLFQHPAWFIVLPGSAEFLNYHEYRNALELQLLEHHLCIDLTHILRKLFKNFSIEMPLTVPIKDNSFEIVELMERGDFDRLTIHKNKKAVAGYDFEKKFSGAESIKKLTEDVPDTEITVKRRGGKITSINRKVTRKFEEKTQG